MTNQEFKYLVIQKLKQRPVFFQDVGNFEIRTRCPFCGDSQKNFNTGHLYLRINPMDNYPILYNCFKCPAKGILKYNDLELFGITGQVYKDAMTTLNLTSNAVTSFHTQEIQSKYFDFHIPKSFQYDWKIHYIEDRIGKEFKEEDLSKMKVITSLRDFMMYNNINAITCKPGVARMFEANYIGFLTANNSHILFRDCTNTMNIRWCKYPITKESIGQRVFYSLESEIDLFTKDTITINLAEGVMDVLGINYNLGFNQKDNTLNMAVCGKYYNSIIKYLFTLGFVGSNVNINIYPDNDHTDDTSLKHYQEIFKNYSYLVNKFTVNYNTLSKDCGVRKEKIMLESYQI